MSIESNVKYLASYIPKSAEKDLMTSRNENCLSEITLEKLQKDFSDPKTEETYRNRALFQVMQELGLLAMEIVSLRLSDVSKESSGQSYVSYVGKCGRKKYSAISEACLNAVQEYHEMFGIDSDFFFVSRPRRNNKERNNLSTRALQLIVNSWNVRTISGRIIHPQSLRNTLGQRLLTKALPL
ncbi:MULTISPECIES: tyrosine-type recombinase/integrase [unclassified Leptospira]|uniref:tyrosine-type recombinase/integrase n=1 Tax=unclassified Leptospira TaxID=2633828 RepID=UPI0002BF00E3|nr:MULTISPECIES: tyrosine-type recombinase/integrase [unclassified Leptospira]EMK01246.1 site-specific recombinase, phage integrase family [Leptospira sp. B5-022]MCR1795453.1 site-specific integrase [Leptospira sp. id769339]